MGAMVRGVSILSLDNEVIAEIISAAASTLAKKVVEKVLFEWFTAYLKDPSVAPDTKRQHLELFAKVHFDPED
jgi:hypothetical protein